MAGPCSRSRIGAMAVATAFRLAAPGDVVLLAGKGHEQTILYASGPIPWDEARVARELAGRARLRRGRRLSDARLPVHAAAGLVALALLVTVGLPPIAAGVLTGAVTAAGLQADDTTVTVASNPPTDLLTLHADVVEITASDATFRGVRIGSLDITLHGVDLPGRTADEVDGRLSDVSLDNGTTGAIGLSRVRLSGGGEAITASSSVPAADARTLVADAVETATGSRPSSVTLTAPDQVRVRLGGLTVHGRLSVTRSGDLVVDIEDGPSAGDRLTVLGADSQQLIHLTGVTVTGSGALRLTGTLEVGLLG